MKKRIKMELTETEQKIILQYRKITWIQPSIRKLLDVIETEPKPQLLNLRKEIPTAQGGQQ